ERDGAVEAVDAALRHALEVVEVGGAGLEALARRPITAPLRALTALALGGGERGCLAKGGRMPRRGLRPVDPEDRPPHPRRDRADLGARPLVLDQRKEAIGTRGEGGVLGPSLELVQEAPGLDDELHLLGVLALVGDVPVLDRARIVDGHVVEYVEN